MKTNAKEILGFIKGVKIAFIKTAAMHLSLDIINGILGILFLLAILQQVYAFRVYHLLFLCLIWFAYVLARWLIEFIHFFSDKAIIGFIEKRTPSLSDKLSNSYSFIKGEPLICSELSASLIDAHLESASDSIRKIEAKKIITKNILAKIGNFVLLIILFSAFYASSPSRFISVFGAVISAHYEIPGVEVSPGDSQVLFAEAINVSLSIPAHYPAAEPSLFVRNGQGRIRLRDLTKLSDGQRNIWSYDFENVYESFKYRFQVGSIKLNEYSINVIKPVVFDEITIRYEYPSYMNLPIRTARNPNIECFAGTKVTISAKATARIDSASMVINDGEVVKKMRLSENNIDATATMIVEKSGFYFFDIWAGGNNFQSPRYRINVVVDEPPAIELLSPAQDIVVAGDETIPVIYSYEDDFGVASARLTYKNKSSGIVREIPLSVVSPRRGIVEYAWRLSPLELKPGDRISYFLTAVDQKGNSGFSRTYFIEVAAYDKMHAQIMSELSSFSEDILKLLSEQSMLHERTKIAEPPVWEDIASEQQNLRAATKTAREKLSETIRKMEADPFFVGYLMKEYTGMGEMLDYLGASPMNRAVKSAEKGDRAGVEQNQKEAISMLEKLSLLSKDVLKHQNLSDFQKRFDRLERRFDDTIDEFEKKSIDELFSEMQEISKLLSEIEQILKDMPHILPEEFINTQAVRDAQFQGAKDAVSSIKESLKKGDVATARQMMEKLREELSKIRDAIKTGAQNLSINRNISDTASKLSSISKKLAAAVERQKDIYDQTAHYEELRQKREFQAQSDILKELARRQKRYNQKAEYLKRNVAGLEPSIVLMEKILAEFMSGRVRHSQKFLKDVIKNIREIKKNINAERKYEIGKLDEIVVGESEILRILTTPPRAEHSPRERRGLDSLSERQQALRNDLGGIQKALDSAMAGTAAVPYKTRENISKAGEEMEHSSKELSGGATAKSMEHQKNAIDLLASESEGLSALGQNLGGVQYGAKPSPTLRAMPPGGVSGGFFGARFQEVKLPGIKDFKVPEEFRSKILRGMREKHPVEYERLVKEYFRRLAE